MLKQNPDGTWDYVINDGIKPVYQWDKNYFPNKPLAKTDTGFSLNIPFVNHDIGTSIYDGIESAVSKVRVHASRLADSLKSGVSTVTQGVTSTASSVGSFVQSTLLKVIVLAVIVAISAIFIMSYTESKARGIANG